MTDASMASLENGEFEMVMPFVSVTSKGGPYDDNAYVAGFEVGQFATLMNVKSGILDRSKPYTLHTENLKQLDLFAMQYDYVMEHEPTDDPAWSFVYFSIGRTSS